jgi:hypothetical protein
MIKHINEIKLEGDDTFTKQFNHCSDLYQKFNDETLSEEEREEYYQKWYMARQCLELGIY